MIQTTHIQEDQSHRNLTKEEQTPTEPSENDFNLPPSKSSSNINTESEVYSSNVIEEDTSNIQEQQTQQTSFIKRLFNYSKFNSKTDIILLIMYMLSMILYLIALIPCVDLKQCNWGLGLRTFLVEGIIVIISCLIVTLLLFYSFFTKKHFIHFIYVLPMYIFFFICFTGIDNIHHGGYNALVYKIFFIYFFLMFSLISFIYFTMSKRYFKLLIGFIIIILILFYLFQSNLIFNYSCTEWDKGLNNTYTDNTSRNYPCTMKHPKKNKCILNAFDNVFDFSVWMGVANCESHKLRHNEYDMFVEYLPEHMKNKTRFGLPITTREDTFSYTIAENPMGFQKIVYSHILDMNEYEQGKIQNEPKPEIELVFDSQSKRGSLNINVNRNETLSNERKQIHTNTPYKNVLLIYIDGISRPNFFRKLKKTSSYLEQFTHYDTNPNTKNFTLFQFMKYNTLRSHTFPNLKPMFYGIPVYETNGTNIVKYFKQNGFVTGHTGTTCGREIFGIKLDKDGDQVKWLDFDSYDHEGITPFCDLNFFNPKFPLERGYNSVFRRCLYGKPVFEYAIEYAKSFWLTYPDNKKFFRIHFNEGHDPSNALLSYFDEPLAEFIQWFHNGGYLKDTFIMIMSDHGLHLPGPWNLINSEDFRIEKTLGTCMIVVPNESKLYESGMYNTLWDNQQIFITPYDIHDTLVHLAFGEDDINTIAYSKHGQSLIRKMNYSERYCESDVLNLTELANNDCKCKRIN